MVPPIQSSLSEQLTNLALTSSPSFDRTDFFMEPKDLELPVHEIAVEATLIDPKNLPSELNWRLILISYPLILPSLVKTVTLGTKQKLAICLTSVMCPDLEYGIRLDRFWWRGSTTEAGFSKAQNWPCFNDIITFLEKVEHRDESSINGEPYIRTDSNWIRKNLERLQENGYLFARQQLFKDAPERAALDDFQEEMENWLPAHQMAVLDAVMAGNSNLYSSSEASGLGDQKALDEFLADMLNHSGQAADGG